MTTITKPRPADDPSTSFYERLVELLDEEEEEWCISREDNPDMSLCGCDMSGPALPDDEVPDENTCAECLRLEKAQQQ